MYLFDLTIDSKHYAATELLNKGEKKVAAKFSEVYKGIDVNSNEEVVIKKLKNCSSYIEDDIERFKNEARFEFNHHNLIQKSYFVEKDNNYYIVRPYIKGIDFKSILNNRKLTKKYTHQKFVCACIIQVLDALQYMHSLNVIHRDIKPSNIIVEYSKNNEIDLENPVIKLIDYGLSFNLNDNSILDDNIFSLIYSPPEQVLGFTELIDFSSDLYSVGISLYEILSNLLPYECDNPLKLISLQLASNLEYHKKIAIPIFTFITKATSKFNFPKPPSMYDVDELIDLLVKGKQLRYQNAEEIKVDLLKLI